MDRTMGSHRRRSSETSTADQDRGANQIPPVPKADDDPITERMDEALPGCDVPLAITDDLAF
jgi:hypothetical protein